MANKFDYSGDGTLGRLLTRLKLTMAGYAKQSEVSDLSKAIADLLPKNQGAANVGKILVVGTDGNLTLTDMPEGGASGDVTGVVDENNNILLTGDLADGTYKLKYENEDGTYTEIGTLEIGAIPEPEPTYTNFADTTSPDWKNECRLTTSIDQVTPLPGCAATNYISVQTGDIVEVSGINFVGGDNRQAANGSFGGIAKAEVMKSTYGEFFGDVTFDSNNLKFTVLGDMTQMRFSGLLTGKATDVVVKITRNGTLL